MLSPGQAQSKLSPAAGPCIQSARRVLLAPGAQLPTALKTFPGQLSQAEKREPLFVLESPGISALMTEFGCQLSWALVTVL